MIEAAGADGGVISIRNGVPPVEASDPPGGVPLPPPDHDPTPHHVPTPAEEAPRPGPADAPELPNEPPLVPPSREAHGHSNHHRNHHKQHK